MYHIIDGICYKIRIFYQVYRALTGNCLTLAQFQKTIYSHFSVMLDDYIHRALEFGDLSMIEEE